MGKSKASIVKLLLGILAAVAFYLIFGKENVSESASANTPGTILYKMDTIRDTVYVEKLVQDTVFITHYVDTSALVIRKKAFLYIKDTFNINDRTFYITENDDTIKVFYHDYTYYIFNYFFKDTIVTVDSVIGCDLYTHCLCDDRERIVVFHTCEGESRMIVNMLNKEKNR